MFDVTLWNLMGTLEALPGSTVVEVPVKFQSDRTILNTNVMTSRHGAWFNIKMSSYWGETIHSVSGYIVVQSSRYVSWYRNFHDNTIWYCIIYSIIMRLPVRNLNIFKNSIYYMYRITKAASWGPDRRKWPFSAIRGGIWTPHSPVLIKISAYKSPLNQLTVINFFSLIIKTFCH